MASGLVTELLERVVSQALQAQRVQRLLAGRMERAELRDLFHRFIVTHLNSVQILSFLHAIVPTPAAGLVRENLLEEMGLEEAEKPHPELLVDLARGLGFSEQDITRLRAEAEESKRLFASAPVRGDLKDLGLSMLLETVAFEAFLSRASDPIARCLVERYGVPLEGARWFTLHGEVDVRHAEEGRQVIEGYAAFYRFTPDRIEEIARAVFSQNVILGRYFGARSADAPARPARIVAVEIIPLRIPFQRSFVHAQTSRAASDAVILKVLGDDGAEGYGEALPRPYVTGEDVKGMVGVLQEVVGPALLKKEFGPGLAVLGQWETFSAALRLPKGHGSLVAWNATLCSIELAVLDWAFRRTGVGLSDWLAPVRQSVEYTGVIDAAEPRAAAALAARYAEAKFRFLKVKVGIGDDAERLQAVRAEAGDNARIRVDANGAWEASQAVAALRALSAFGIEAVEQPVAAGDIEGLIRVRKETGLPVIADESLVTIADAERLIAQGACDIFNVRVSKCGGLLPSKKICDLAAQAGMRVQVGAQVGETSILSSAGRHLALAISQIEYAEGSFGTHLLQEDVTGDPVMFGYRGVGGPLYGPGLGVAVERSVLERLTTGIIRVGG